MGRTVAFCARRGGDRHARAGSRRGPGRQAPAGRAGRRRVRSDGRGHVAGAWLALRRPGRHGAWLGAASGALLVIALLHLLPDAWSAARAAGIWPLAVPAAALGSFALAGLAARQGCACDAGRQHAGGAGRAGAPAPPPLLVGDAPARAPPRTLTLGPAVRA